MNQFSDNFTLLRLVLALAVMFSHSYPFSGRIEPGILEASVGGFAVYCFFVISGYLIAGSYLATDRLWRFALKRFLRIVPALLVAVPASIWLFEHQEQYVGNAIAYIYNGSLWTISWEALLYVLVAVIGVTDLLSAPVLGAACISGFVLLFAGLKDGASRAETFIAPFFLLFAVGGLIRLTEDKIDLRRCGAVACVVLAALMLPVSAELHEAMRTNNMLFNLGPDVPWAKMRWFVGLMALPFAVIFVARCFPVSLPLRADYSYGVYIYAWPVQESLVYQAHHFGIPFGPRMLFLVSAAVTFACAFVSWHLIERNALWLSHWKGFGDARSLRDWIGRDWLRARFVAGVPLVLAARRRPLRERDAGGNG